MSAGHSYDFISLFLYNDIMYGACFFTLILCALSAVSSLAAALDDAQTREVNSLPKCLGCVPDRGLPCPVIRPPFNLDELVGKRGLVPIEIFSGEPNPYQTSSVVQSKRAINLGPVRFPSPTPTSPPQYPHGEPTYYAAMESDNKKRALETIPAPAGERQQVAAQLSAARAALMPTPI